MVSSKAGGLVRDMSMELSVNETDGIIARGGTILGSSRTNPYKNAETDLPKLRETFAKHGLDAMVAIGGDDTLGVANRLHNDFQMPLVGVPKTIDNDLNVTDFTFGFDTAVNIVIEAIDRLRTTSESHRRIMVVETMGRQAGWIACFSGIAAAADYVMVPEVPIDIEHCIGVLKRRRSEGKNYGIVVVSEGAKFPNQDETTLSEKKDEFGHAQLGGIAALVAQKVEKATGFRDSLRRPGPYPERRRAERLRPRSSHPFRPGGRRAGSPEAFWNHGCAVGDEDRRSPSARWRGEPQESRS